MAIGHRQHRQHQVRPRGIETLSQDAGNDAVFSNPWCASGANGPEIGWLSEIVERVRHGLTGFSGVARQRVVHCLTDAITATRHDNEPANLEEAVHDDLGHHIAELHGLNCSLELIPGTQHRRLLGFGQSGERTLRFAEHAMASLSRYFR